MYKVLLLYRKLETSTSIHFFEKDIANLENGTKRYIETVAYLGKLYDFINERLFGGELVKPVITIQVDSRNKAYGWWSKQKVWKDSKNDEGVHELNLCAQYLNRPIENIAETMIHEMCHQFASVHNLQDCSRSSLYHNKLFKQIAESHGLTAVKVEIIGYSQTSLTAETAELIKQFVSANDESVIYREPFTKNSVVKSSSTRKYVCPCCHTSVRATKEVNIMCADCDEYMIQE